MCHLKVVKGQGHEGSTSCPGQASSLGVKRLIVHGFTLERENVKVDHENVTWFFTTLADGKLYVRHKLQDFVTKRVKIVVGKRKWWLPVFSAF